MSLFMFLGVRRKPVLVELISRVSVDGYDYMTAYVDTSMLPLNSQTGASFSGEGLVLPDTDDRIRSLNVLSNTFLENNHGFIAVSG